LHLFIFLGAFDLFNFLVKEPKLVNNSDKVAESSVTEKDSGLQMHGTGEDLQKEVNEESKEDSEERKLQIQRVLKALKNSVQVDEVVLKSSKKIGRGVPPKRKTVQSKPGGSRPKNKKLELLKKSFSFL
jgi:hypothetical protein